VKDHGKKKKYKAISMCSFCSLDFNVCGAQPVFVKDIEFSDESVHPKSAVIACDKYRSPVEILQKRFH